MHKLTKILIATLTLVLLIGCVFTFVACVDEDKPIEYGEGYKFIVVNADGEKIAGIEVQICLDELCLTPVTTDKNGIAYFSADSTDAGVYQVHLITAGDGSVKINGSASNYTFDNDSIVTKAEYGEYTLTLVSK